MHGNTFDRRAGRYRARLPGGVDLYSHGASSTARLKGLKMPRAFAGVARGPTVGPDAAAFRLRLDPQRRYDHIGFLVRAVRR